MWLLIFSAPCLAKDWMNIFPLKTTRAEVVQMLGKPQTNQSDESEYFEIDKQTVTFRWTRPNCYGQNSIIENQPISLDALVFQITVEPKEPNDKRYKKIVSELNEDSSDSTDSKKSKYKRSLSNYVDCLIGADGTSCTITNTEKGLGYSDSKAGIISIYYFPTNKEIKTWEETHQPCKVEQDEKLN